MGLLPVTCLAVKVQKPQDFGAEEQKKEPMKNVVEFLTGEDLPQYDNTDNFGAKHDDANLTKAEKKAAKKADKKDDKKADKKTAKKADKKAAKKADKKADKKVAKKAAKAEQELLEEPMTVSRKPSLMTLATASRSASARGSLIDKIKTEHFPILVLKPVLFESPRTKHYKLYTFLESMI